MLLTGSLCLQLEAFLERWRAELKPSHSFVFTMRNGEPMTVQGVHRLFVSACYRLVRRPYSLLEDVQPCWPLLAALCLVSTSPRHAKYTVTARVLITTQLMHRQCATACMAELVLQLSFFRRCDKVR